jgi:hypothetical protein
MYEYGILKPLEVILGRGRGGGRKMEMMNQTSVYGTHTVNSPHTTIIY